MYGDGLAREDNRGLYGIVDTVAEAVAYLDGFEAAPVRAKWVR